MKFGIKFWSTNKELLRQARAAYEKKEFDSLELSAIVGTFDPALLDLVKGIPCVIHCDNTDVDFSMESFRTANVRALHEAIAFADFLDAKYIIVHPGYSGTYEATAALLAEFWDDRFCMENMPGMTYNLSGFCIGRTKEELDLLRFNHFCLDLAHALKAAITLKLDNTKHITELNTYKPVCYHISDGVFTNEKDEHLNIGEGAFDFKYLRKFVRDDALVTLETPKKDYNSLADDLGNVRKLKELFGIKAHAKMESRAH